MNLLWQIIWQGIRHPKQVAIIDDQRKWTYGKLLGGSLFIAQHLDQTTSARNVGIMLPTSGAFPAALLGVWMSNRVAVPLNYLLSPEELEYVVNDSDIDTIITAGAMLDFLGDDYQFPDNVKLLKLEDLDFTGAPEFRWPPFKHKDDLAALLYTSGTSGKPKGVMLSHGNFAADVKAAVIHAQLTEKDIFMGVLPQFHSFGLTALTLIPLAIGSKIIYTARFMPKKIIELMRKHRPGIFMGVPSMYGALFSVKGAEAEDFSSLRYAISGAEPLPTAVYEKARDRFNLQIFEGFGLTETTPATNWSTHHQNRLHSVGLPLPTVRQFILDDEDRILPPNHEGELVIAGPIVMQGYYKQPKLTHEVIFQLRIPGEDMPLRTFRTGDIGKIDDDGFLYITGRKKEMLIISGENVFPREIEEVINSHDAVLASAVIGRKDDVRGEVAVAYVEMNPGMTFDEKDIRNFCRQKLSQFKVPREIKVLDALPRNGTGKIMRRKIEP